MIAILSGQPIPDRVHHVSEAIGRVVVELVEFEHRPFKHQQCSQVSGHGHSLPIESERQLGIFALGPVESCIFGRSARSASISASA